MGIIGPIMPIIPLVMPKPDPAFVIIIMVCLDRKLSSIMQVMSASHLYLLLLILLAGIAGASHRDNS